LAKEKSDFKIKRVQVSDAKKLQGKKSKKKKKEKKKKKKKDEGEGVLDYFKKSDNNVCLKRLVRSCCSLEMSPLVFASE
jgi:hypothetical protein